MNFFQKKANNSQRVETDIQKIAFKNIMNDAKDLLKISINPKEELHPIFTFIKQFTDLITLNSAIHSFETSSSDTYSEVQNIFEARKNTHSFPLIERIELNIHPDDYRYYVGEFTTDLNRINMNIASEPIILMPWNHLRTRRLIKTVGTKDNPFSIDKRKQDPIRNAYYFPIGVTVCESGNHAQFVAELKGEGNTVISELINIESLYDFVSFDGRRFHYNFNNDTPHSFSCKSREDYYTGVLFEIGRLLKDYPQVFPIEVQYALSNKYPVMPKS